MSLAFALFLAAWLHVFRREGQTAHELAEALIRLCTDQGNPNLVPFGIATLGWVLAEHGEEEKGIVLIRQALATLPALGQEINQPTCLAWLAEAYQKAERVEKGLSTLVEALEVAGHTEERWYEAELYRLKGELALQSGVRSPKSPAPNT